MQNLWKDKEANFPETFIGKTKHQGPKLTYFKNILKLFLKELKRVGDNKTVLQLK